jgi:hypothetical protein
VKDAWDCTVVGPKCNCVAYHPAATPTLAPPPSSSVGGGPLTQAEARELLELIADDRKLIARWKTHGFIVNTMEERMLDLAQRAADAVITKETP